MGTKETGQARRKRLLKAGLCTACGKRKHERKSKAKGGGFYMECAKCRAYYSNWAKQRAKLQAEAAAKAAPAKAVAKKAEDWMKFKNKRTPVMILTKSPKKLSAKEIVRDLDTLVQRGVVQISTAVH